jgi:hypothetical protein
LDPVGTAVGPHVTLVPSFRASARDAVAAVRAVAAALVAAAKASADETGVATSRPAPSGGGGGRLSFPLQVQLAGVGTSDALPFRALVLEVAPSAALLHARATALQALAKALPPPLPPPPLPPPAAAAAALPAPSLADAATKAAAAAATVAAAAAARAPSNPPEPPWAALLGHAYAPHLSLSYGAPLSARNKALASAAFRTFPRAAAADAAAAESATAAAEVAADGGAVGESGSVCDASSNFCADVSANLAALEFGEVALSGIALMACEGDEWACWAHVETVDLTAPSPAKPEP